MTLWQLMLLGTWCTVTYIIYTVICTVTYAVNIHVYVYVRIHPFYRQLGSGHSPQSCLYFQVFLTNFKYFPVIYQHSSLTYGIVLIKDQSSSYEIRSLAICMNIKTFNRVSRKQMNILKIFLDYLKFYIVVY